MPFIQFSVLFSLSNQRHWRVNSFPFWQSSRSCVKKFEQCHKSSTDFGKPLLVYIEPLGQIDNAQGQIQCSNTGTLFPRQNLSPSWYFLSLRLSKTKDSFQGRLDSNVQSTMSRMARELIWNKPSNHRRPKPGICTISMNCPFMTRCQKKLSGKIDIAY